MEHPKLLLLLACILALASTLATASASQNELLIGAFNVQIFGQKKSSNETLMNVIVKIIRRYDLILIQEIRDKTDGTIDRLMKALNNQGSVHFSHVTSDRLGSSTSTEQYSFLIRSNSGISFKDKYQYQSQNVTFERPPFSVIFKSKKTEVKEFVLTALHSKPEEAVKEIGQLYDVHAALQKKWNTDNILILGDLNAGCNYAKNKTLNSLEIRKNPKFRWLISDNVDTTTKNSNCPYDRFIMTGAKFNKSLIVNSARVFRFDKEFSVPHGLTTEVSDHYPIELKLRSVSSDLKSVSLENFSNIGCSSNMETGVFLAMVLIGANLALFK